VGTRTTLNTFLRATGEVTLQQVQQSLEIDSIRLRAPSPAIHLEARGIDHEILDAVRDQEAMQPEAIAAGLVQAHHANRRNSASRNPKRISLLRAAGELALRPLDRREQPAPIACDHLAPKDLPSKAPGKAQLPAPLAELEGHAKRVVQCGRIKTAGRCCHRVLLR
jgi:hypothetical protein